MRNLFNESPKLIIRDGKVTMLPILIIHLAYVTKQERIDEIRQEYIKQFGHNVVVFDARVKSYSVLTNAKDEEFILIEKGGKID